LISILENANEFFKKNINNFKEKLGIDLKMIKSMKSFTKYMMNLFKVKGMKNKYSIINEAENYLKDSKKSGDVKNFYYILEKPKCPE
jgi:hypothetical protein